MRALFHRIRRRNQITDEALMEFLEGVGGNLEILLSMFEG
jgi:hypothetical protein